MTEIGGESLIQYWWLRHALGVGTRDERTELERGDSLRAARASRAWQLVQDVVDSGGGAALDLISALLAGAPRP